MTHFPRQLDTSSTTSKDEKEVSVLPSFPTQRSSSFFRALRLLRASTQQLIFPSQASCDAALAHLDAVGLAPCQHDFFFLTWSISHRPVWPFSSRERHPASSQKEKHPKIDSAFAEYSSLTHSPHCVLFSFSQTRFSINGKKGGRGLKKKKRNGWVKREKAREKREKTGQRKKPLLNCLSKYRKKERSIFLFTCFFFPQAWTRSLSQAFSHSLPWIFQFSPIWTRVPSNDSSLVHP